MSFDLSASASGDLESSTSSLSGVASANQPPPPPLSLLEFPPLASLYNDILNVFNDFRPTATLDALFPTKEAIVDHLQAAARVCVAVFDSLKNSFTESETENFQRLCLLFVETLVPNVVKCFKCLFPSQQIAEALGVGIGEVHKSNVFTIEVSKIRGVFDKETFPNLAETIAAEEEETVEELTDGVMLDLPLVSVSEVASSEPASLEPASLEPASLEPASLEPASLESVSEAKSVVDPLVECVGDNLCQVSDQIIVEGHVVDEEITAPSVQDDVSKGELLGSEPTDAISVAPSDLPPLLMEAEKDKTDIVAESNEIIGEPAAEQLEESGLIETDSTLVGPDAKGGETSAPVQIDTTETENLSSRNAEILEQDDPVTASNLAEQLNKDESQIIPDLATVSSESIPQTNAETLIGSEAVPDHGIPNDVVQNADAPIFTEDDSPVQGESPVTSKDSESVLITDDKEDL